MEICILGWIIIICFAISTITDIILFCKLLKTKGIILTTKELACENSKEIGEHDRALLDIQTELKRG